MSDVKHVKLRIRGKVQGVFYRASAKQKADELGVKGFVKNEKDGSVYLEAEGEESTIYKFIKWCNIGPSGADVDAVEIVEGDSLNFKIFEIIR